MNKGKFIGRLCTKDGRKFTNAYCYGYDENKKQFKIETDFGNKIMLIEEDMNEYFYLMHEDQLVPTYNEWKQGRDKIVSKKLIDKIDSIAKDNHFLCKKLDSFKDNTCSALIYGLYNIFYDIEDKKYIPQNTSLQPPWDRYKNDTRFHHVVNTLVRHIFTTVYVCPPPHPSLKIDLSASSIPESMKGKI